MRKLIICGREVAAVKYLPGGSATEKYAAEELNKYLSKMADIADHGDFPVYLTVDAALPKEGYTITPKEDSLTVAGGTGRGLLYGVYRFLEKFGGARFFTPTLEVLGEGDIVVEEPYSFAPPFEYRRCDWVCSEDEDWSVKNGINSFAISEEKGGYMEYGGFCHTMYALTGTDHRLQPCLSDPALLEKAIESVRTILRENPAVSIVSVSQNDNMNYCKCDKCMAVAEEEGSQMGPLLRFVNAVADAVKDEFPDAIIDTLAYTYSRKPPLLTKPRENVCIRLCSIECCYSHPLEDRSCPSNNAFHDDIIAWNKICDRIYIWDYITNFLFYVPTFPNFGVLRENMRFFADHGVRGMYPEGNYNSAGTGEFAELRCYLVAKLMTDPYMSAVEYYTYMDEFLAAFYGAGWRNIRTYIDMMCGAARKMHAKIYSKPFAMFPRDYCEEMRDVIDRLWEDAEEKAEGQCKEEVHRSRLQWRYLKLMLQPNLEEGTKFFEEAKGYKIRFNEWLPEPKDPDLSLTPDEWIPKWH